MDPYLDALPATVSGAVEMIRNTRERQSLTHYSLAKAAKISRQTSANVVADTKYPGLPLPHSPLESQVIRDGKHAVLQLHAAAGGAGAAGGHG